MADTGAAVPQAKPQATKIEFVDRRRGRYLAQALDEFEEKIEPLLPKDVAQAYKVTMRRKFGALSADVISLLEAGDQAKNELAQEIHDRLFVDGAPRRD